MVLDRLCALIEPAVKNAPASPDQEGIAPLELELEPFATTPSGVGLDVPAWIGRLQSELERVRTSQSDLSHLAETRFQVPKIGVAFAVLVEQMGDWEERSREE
jgi:hypothetical protein